MQAKIIVKMVEQCMSNHNVVKFWSLGLDKITPRVARVSKIIVRVGSGWRIKLMEIAKGKNLGSCKLFLLQCIFRRALFIDDFNLRVPQYHN